LVVASILYACLQVVTQALTLDGRVHALTEANFAASVHKHPYSFVEFYAPWCGHCKKLEPEWEKTAAYQYVPVAKVDAIAEDKLASRHGVQSFPTLMLFKGDASVAVKYTGPRDASSMGAWLSKWTDLQVLAARPEATEAGLEAWASGAKLKLLGLLSGQTQEDAAVGELLEAAAFMLNPAGPGSEVAVGAVMLSGGEIAKLGITGVTLPCVVLMRDFDLEERTVIYEDYRQGMQPFMSWMEQKRTPALIPASRETEQLFLKDIQPGNALAVLFGSNQHSTREIHKLAVEMRSSSSTLKWVHAKEDDFGKSLAKNVGLEADAFPEFLIWEFGESEDEDRFFKLSQQVPNAFNDLGQSARNFVSQWQSGVLAGHGAKAVPPSPTPPPPAKKPLPDKKKVAKKTKSGFKEVPCPADADIFACSTWCEESSSDTVKLVGTLGGKPCADWKPTDPPHDATTCTCYDQDFTEVHLSCKPECVKAQGNGDGAGTCAAGDSSCMLQNSEMPPENYDEDDDIAADF